MFTNRAFRPNRAFISLIAVSALVLGACAESEETSTTPPTVTTTESETTSDTEPPMEDEFVPEHSVPADFPIYPGAVMYYELPASGEAYTWMFLTSGSAEEILEFYETSLSEHGVTVVSSVAVHEEFFLKADIPGYEAEEYTSAITIGFLNDDDLPSPVTPSTPGRGYMLRLDVAGWRSR